MKKIIWLILVVLLLTGCQTPAAETTSAPETTAAPLEVTRPEEMTFPTIPAVGGIPGTPEGDEIAFENPGKVRLTYTGNRSYALLVSRVEDLPDEEALKIYDEAFFQEHDLLILVETVNSGSVQLEIGGIYRDGDTATVQLTRTLPGDFGTADMATWLLWAEVEKGLDCTWTIGNASQLPQGEKY